MIRQATGADVAGFTALTRRAYEGYQTLLGRDPTPMHRNYAPLAAAGGLWVDDNLRGGVALEAEKNALIIYSLVVDPECQRQGVGQALLQFSELRARTFGTASLRLCTSDKMHRNIEIYQAFGFNEVSREDIGLAASPMIVWMEKSLQA